jgi:hypothetical protein
VDFLKRPSEGWSGSKLVNALAGQFQTVIDRFRQPGAKFQKTSRHLVAIGRQSDNRSGWSFGPVVGHQIRDRDIDLVPNRGHNWNCGCENRIRNDLLVEGPQVFGTPASTPENDCIEGKFAGTVQVVEQSNRGSNFPCGSFTLNPTEMHNEFCEGPPLGEKFDHISDGGPAGTSDEPDTMGEPRQRAFSQRIEIPFGEQFLLELPEGEFGCPDSLRLDVLNEELVFTARLVDGEPAAGKDFKPVFRIESHPQIESAKHDRPNLCSSIFESEVPVSGGGAREV